MKNLFVAVFLLGGLALVYAGALPLWVWLVLTAVTLGLRVLSHADAYSDELTLTDDGLTRRHGSRLRKVQQESLRWQELEKVEVLSNEAGPARKDLLFLLYGAGTNGVAVPAPLAQQHELVAVLQRRLPAFSEEQLAQAQAASGRARFTLWERA